MRRIYKYIVKPIFFLFDAEDIHNILTFKGNILSKFKILRYLTAKLFRYDNPSLNQEIFGIKFSNPVGLSAGFDYDGKLTNIMHSVGFGFESVGTVTYSKYEGNIKPRLGRLPMSKSLLVNKGFKSDGIVKVLNNNITNPTDSDFNLGISIGATNSPECSTSEAQIEDILRSLQYLKSHNNYGYFKYVEINISCPNVLGSGSLANEKSLTTLLTKINELELNKPIFIKFPLEIDWEEAKKLINIMIEYKIDAVILSNLKKVRDEKYFSKDELAKFETFKGNFSGKPTFDLSNELISKVYKEFGDKIKIVGVGGIFSAQDAYRKIELGASLVQLITGMIYEGPMLIGDINKGLTEILRSKGFKNISEAVGSASR